MKMHSPLPLACEVLGHAWRAAGEGLEKCADCPVTRRTTRANAPPARQSSCANCTEERPLQLAEHKGRQFWLCHGCRSGLAGKGRLPEVKLNTPTRRGEPRVGERPTLEEHQRSTRPVSFSEELTELVRRGR